MTAMLYGECNVTRGKADAKLSRRDARGTVHLMYTPTIELT